MRKDAKDIFLLEAVHILSDEIDVTRADPQLARGNKAATEATLP
jgi:hypothetical protein